MNAIMKKHHFSAKKWIVLITLAVFILYIAVSVITVTIDIQNSQAVLAQKQGQLEEQRILNNELSDMIESGEVEDYIARIAREKYGYVFPDEEVYIDISGK